MSDLKGPEIVITQPELKRAVAQVLKDDYGFQTTLLLDALASRGNILKQLDRFKKSLNAEDRFFLYYAGHSIFAAVLLRALKSPG